jgi:phosphatidylinositol glycan class B
MLAENVLPTVPCGDAPPWSLRTYLAIGLLLRLPAVLFAGGYSFLDQQYQAIDPAWHLASGDAWDQTWEWIDGIRSLVYPGLLAAMFRGCRWLGVDAPLPMLTVVRAGHALISLLPLALFWQLVVRWQPLPRARLPLLLFAGSGLGVHIGVQPSAITFAAVLSVAAVLAFQGPGRWALLSGLLLGLAFCCRFQEACFGPALLGVALWQRRFAASAWFALGGLVVVAAQGWLDLRCYGRFLHSARAYWLENVDLGAARKWESGPWWYYLAELALVLVLVPPFWRVGGRALRAGACYLPAVAAAIALHLLLHSWPERKAWRFVLPALWLGIGVLGAGGALVGARSALARWHTRALVAVQVALWLWASFWFANAGAVHAADALRTEPTFTDELIAVDGSAQSVGGYFYLRRPTLSVRGVPRAELRTFLAAAAPRAVRWLLTDSPLTASDVGAAGQLIPVAMYPGMFDWRRRDRRHLYRLEKGP